MLATGLAYSRVDIKALAGPRAEYPVALPLIYSLPCLLQSSWRIQ